MKTLSNTSIAAIFALGLTLLVGLLDLVPYFHDKETQTTDEMLLLRYQLHQKYAPIKPDSHLVFAGIDQNTLDIVGRWPFDRSVHGDFLIVLAKESPRAVGWDIFFTEQESVNAQTATAPAPAPQEATAPAGTGSPPPSPETPSAPSVNPSPASEVQPAPAAPASPSPSDTNAAPAAPVPPTAGSSAANFSLNSMRIGAGPSSTSASPAPAPSPADSTPPTAAPPATATPATADSAPAATAGSASDETPPLSPGDQHFVDAASLFPNIVTAAEINPRPQDPKHPLTVQSLLPTRALHHVTGDITKLLSAPNATLPFSALRQKTYFGFVNENGESGGGSRRTDPMVVNIAGMVLPSFDLQVLMQYLGADPESVIVNLGYEITVPRPDGTLIHIPIDQKGQMTLNYRARIEDFQEMSFAPMGKGLIDKAQGDKSRERDALPPIKDNIVIIGATFNGIDSGPTPLDNNSPLVVTHLNALTNILQQDFLKPVPSWVWMPIYALFLFGTGALMLRVGIAPMIPMGLLALCALAVAAFAALYANYQVPIFTPEIGILLLAGAVPTKRFFGEEREKIRVRKAMGAYLSDRVMTKILAHPDGVKLGGVKQVITIMFCDIRGFTAYCDNRDPQEVLTVVNEYFEEMTQVVFKYEGTVDKYIGDCIMAFWNAPDDQPDHAQRAVCCAMEMRYALANFKVKRAGLDTELFECGIGIHTGEALVGNMGSTLKVNYTAMGSTVNLGARLESLTKKFNERILISQATLDALTGDFPITDRGETMVPGFANPIHVYGVGAEQDLGSAIQVGLKLAKKQDYTAEEVTKPIWAPAPLPEDADPNHGG